MELKEIDVALLRNAFLSGAKSLDSKKDWINELNVFPVPDGDTGTNMTLTIMSAAKEVSELQEPDMAGLCKAISSGSLRGARGNSGVILSQLLRGFVKEIGNSEKIDAVLLTAALQRATETAYKAVMKPKEGTILTVAKSMSEKASGSVTEAEELISFMNEIITCGDETLKKTPDMLPVLKQAGVVDSGGQGLMVFVKGALQGLTGGEVEFSCEESGSSVKPSSGTVDTSELETADIKFGYCTEFIIQHGGSFTEEDEQEFKSFLESIGDSIVCVADDEIVKVHVHTNDPGLAIQKGLLYGQLSRMKIDNMREEHHERLIKDASQIAARQKKEEEEKKKAQPRKPFGFIAVSSGSGLSEIFKGIGVDRLIEGGQTMNPSTDDILNAVREVNADTVFVLPNNKNIILAAQQAAAMSEDRKIIVVPSANIPQGISAMINFMPDSTAEENLDTMVSEMSRIHTGEVTYAVRNTNIDGFDIHEGDIMAIGDQGMITVGKAIEGTVIDALKKLVDADSELISLYFGNEVTETDADHLKEEASRVFPDAEIELHNGGQPVYYYLIAVE